MIRPDHRARVQVGLVGYGAVAALHVDALADLGSIRWVAGPNPASRDVFAKRHRIPASYGDIQAAVRDARVDAVVIASPSAAHAEQVESALSAGAHVLCEVPLALSAREAVHLVELADGLGLTLGVCQTLRYFEPLRVAMTLLDGDRVTNVVARDLSLRIDDVGWTGRPRTWTDDVLWHHGGHVIDAVMRFMGSTDVEVEAVAGPRPLDGRPRRDYGVVLRSAHGAIASVALSYSTRISAGDYVITGDVHTVLVADGAVSTENGPVLPPPSNFGSLLASSIRTQDADFVESLRGDRRMIADGRSILPTMRVLERIAVAVGDGASAASS
ncbi:MAG: Gfo/Idh/MocA family oxidoreductase [Chloroflexi bacterium]|nr:Gfo/Idh/MocA family oxidoreductase [Chloroflexota bacterium]